MGRYRIWIYEHGETGLQTAMSPDIAGLFMSATNREKMHADLPRVVPYLLRNGPRPIPPEGNGWAKADEFVFDFDGDALCFECDTPLVRMGPICPKCNPGLCTDDVTNAVRVAKQATGLSEFEQARYERTGEIVVNLPFDPCPTCGSDGVHAESCPAFADQPEAMKQATGED